jgi:hypothetical protein
MRRIRLVEVSRLKKQRILVQLVNINAAWTLVIQQFKRKHPFPEQVGHLSTISE